MKIIIFAGGTLGHIMPAFELIKIIKKQNNNCKIIFVATLKDKKFEILQDKTIDKLYYIESYGLTANISKNLKNIKAYNLIKSIIKKEDVSLAIGFGGYISGIGIYAASKLKIKTIIHEQNSIMGRSNKYILRYVDYVYLSYPINKLKHKNIHIVGSPLFNAAKEIKQSIYKKKNTILITSGSLGSKRINELAQILVKSNYYEKYFFTIITGDNYYEEVSKNLNNFTNVKVLSRTLNLVKLIAENEIVISRGGASTLFEIMGTVTPSIIIPSPNVVNNHQYYNALYFHNLGCLKMIEEKYLTISSFIHLFNTILIDKNDIIKNIKQLKYDESINMIIKEISNE